MTIQFPSSRSVVSDRIKSDVKSQLPNSNPFLRNSYLQSLIYGLSGRLFDIYRTEQNLLNQLFWDTATEDFLERWAAIYGITRNPAVGSRGFITVTGTVGSIVPISTVLQSSSGIEYITTAQATIVANSVTLTSLTQVSGIATATTPSDHGLAIGVQVTVSGATPTGYNGLVTITGVPSATTFQYTVDSGLSTPASGTITVTYNSNSIYCLSVTQGSNTNLDSGSELTFTSPISGVDDITYAEWEGFQGGSDAESDDALRSRFLERVRNPVALFNENAIISKAREVTGVTRVWVFNVDTTQGSIAASSLTQTGGVATFTTASAHTLVDGQQVSVTGANEAGYNVSNARILVTDSTTFHYLVNSATASPATGTITAAYSLVEAGQVKVFFTRDNDSTIIPSTLEVADVKDSILEIKPAHVSDSDVIVSAPTPVTVNFTFTALSPDTTTMRTAVTDNLTAFFQENTDIGVNITQGQYNNAIYNSVDSETNDRVQSFTLSSPSGDVTIGREEIGILGNIIYSI